MQGIFPVIPTPFTATGGVDFEGLRRILERTTTAGVDGLMLLGSGSESAYLTETEREQIVRFSRERSGALTNVVGVIAFGTEQAVTEAKRFRDLGADALLLALPQYYRTPFDAIVSHCEAVVDAVDIPVLYYHYPETTHLRLSPSEVGFLFSRVALAGIKESGLSTPELRRHLRRIRRPVSLFSGQSFNLLSALRTGAAGAICPVPLLMPKTALELLRAAKAGDGKLARAAQARLLEALPLVSGATAPARIVKGIVRIAIETGIPLPQKISLPHAGIKEALNALGVIACADVRAPQASLSDAQRRRVRGLVRHLDET